MYIPAEIDKITAHALNELFEVSGTDLPRVSEVKAKPLDGGNGYLAKSYRLHVGWAGERASDAPETLAAKLPLRARLDAMTPDAVRMYRREAMFHRVVAPQVPLRTAKAWVAELDETSQAATLIYEDFGWMQSFEDDEDVSAERVEKALVELSGLHASYWLSKELEGFDWLAYPSKTGVDQVPAERFKKRWPRMVESGAYPLSKAQLKLGEMLSEKMDGVYEALHAGPESVIHTDLHQENIFFDGNNPAFIDFALAERANPAKDVAKLTVSCLKPGTIGREQPELIRSYLKELKRHDIEPPSLKDFERYVHLATCHYLAMAVFLDDSKDFDELVANPETRSDFTASRIVAACDREEVLAVVEAI